jgi:DNA-binding MarR family transcriptional regulator
VPEGTDRIELTPIEWRVVVLAARGMSLADLARRLNADRDEVGGVVTELSARGLLATVG